MRDPTPDPPTVQTAYPDGHAPTVCHCGVPVVVRDSMIHCSRCRGVFRVGAVALVKVGKLTEPAA